MIQGEQSGTKPKIKWLITTLIALVAAGGGFAAWKAYFSPKQYSETFKQEDFNSPLPISLSLDRAGEINLQSTASVVTHNPDYGKTGWLLGSGVRAVVSVNGSECARKENLVKEAIRDGSRNLSVKVICSRQLPKGSHYVEVSAIFLGNCKKLIHSPKTCNTKTISGSYSVKEAGVFNR